MAQFHDAPARYLALMRDALPAYDRMQDALAQATADVAATRILDLGTGTGETARRVLAAHPGAHVLSRGCATRAWNRRAVRWAEGDLAVVAAST